MTRDEFLKHAEQEIEETFKPVKEHLMNIIQQAWAEGKKNAESQYIDEIGADILERLKKKLEEESPNVYVEPPNIGQIPAPAWHGSWAEEEAKKWGPYPNDGIPAACRVCSNHPSNGGSGICHCTLGVTPVYCSSTIADICNAIESDKMQVSDEIASAIGSKRDKEVYNSCCDNHIKIIHDMMTGAKKDGENN